jgi:TRAP-type C4-dicarboxylate transport system permease small subunit
MTRTLLRFANALMSVIRVASGLLLAASVAVNFANIIGRYFFAVSIPWAEEMMLFLMVGCVFFGVGLVGWHGRHIRMDVVVSALPPRARAAVEIFVEIVLVLTSVALAIFAWPVLTMLAEFDQRSTSANFPLVIPQAMLPVGFLLMALLVAIRLIVVGRARHSPDEPAEH